METTNIQTANSGKRLYTITEMTKEIGGTKSYWRKQIQDGKLPYVKVGKKLFIDTQDVDAYIQGNKFTN